jgi:hypothetical protein
MGQGPTGETTRLLQADGGGDRAAALLPVVYKELERLGRGCGDGC